MEEHNAKFLEDFKETDLCSIATVSPEFEETHLDDELLGHHETPMFTPAEILPLLPSDNSPILPEREISNDAHDPHDAAQETEMGVLAQPIVG